MLQIILGKKGVHPNAALGLIVDGQVKAFAGVEKIVYCNTDSQALLQQTSTVLNSVFGGKK